MNEDRLEGDYPRWFWALVAVGVLVAALFPLLFFLWSRSQVRSVATANRDQCLTNLRDLWQAADMYRLDNGALPPASKWTGAMEPVLKRRPGGAMLMKCPSFDAPWGYAMQTALGGRAASEIARPGEALVFFDSSSGRPNAHDDVASFPRKERHLGAGNAVFADGHAASLTYAATRPFVLASLHHGGG